MANEDIDVSRVPLVTTRSTRKPGGGRVSIWRRRRWLFTGALCGVLAVALGATSYIVTRPKYADPPEAARVLAAQEGLNVGILIPAYMPRGFDRKNVELTMNPNGPSGQPVVDLVYRWKARSAAITFRQWVPVNPALETLSGSRPIETEWGPGWLLTTNANSLATVWVDIGQLRVNVSSANLDLVSKEELVMMANTLGLASDQQTYSFVSEPLVIRGVAPPPPFEVPVNAAGIQELNLTITPGGYSPIRFAVKAGTPVMVHFRAIGQVGCGNDVVMPYDRVNSAGAVLEQLTETETFEFTPTVPGDYQFNCAHYTFRGIMTVR